MAHDVFISYSSNDKPTADAACAVLEQKGIRCWIAPRDIVPGADWGESIIDAINDARALVLVFSSHANASPQIKREVERAVNKGIPIIPLRIEDVAPTKSLEYFISTPHWLDAYNPPLERHLTYLADVIAHILEGDTLQPRPQPVVRKSRRGVMLGAVAAICVLGALGAWYFTREPATPTFVGKWELASVTLGKGSLRPNGPAFATDWFAKAALEGPDVHGTFEVNSLGQYELTLAATDRGAFVTSLEELNTVTFTSDITNTATTLKYIIIQPKTAKDMIDQIGGQEGESALLLTANPTHLQAMLAGKPLGPGPLGTFHRRDLACRCERQRQDARDSCRARNHRRRPLPVPRRDAGEWLVGGGRRQVDTQTARRAGREGHVSVRRPRQRDHGRHHRHLGLATRRLDLPHARTKDCSWTASPLQSCHILGIGSRTC